MGLALIDEPEDEPPCPTQVEMCVERCRWDREPVVPSRCEARRPCSCELVPLELPPITMVAPMLSPLVEPPPAVEPPPPPEPPPEAPPPPAVAEKTAAVEPALDTKSSRAARDAKVEAAKSASIARVLGTYGKPSTGTVFDVIESTENNLGDLFETTDGVGHGSLQDASGIKVEGGGGSVGQVSQGKSAPPKSEVTSTGVADPDALRVQVMRRAASVRGCHERALKTDPTLAGKLTLTLEVSEGRVTSTKVHDEGLGSPSVAKCVRAKAAGWRLKKTVSGSVEVSFVFSSG